MELVILYMLLFEMFFFISYFDIKDIFKLVSLDSRLFLLIYWLFMIFIYFNIDVYLWFYVYIVIRIILLFFILSFFIGIDIEFLDVYKIDLFDLFSFLNLVINFIGGF